MSKPTTRHEKSWRETRTRILKRDNYRCQGCETAVTFDSGNVHHIQPRAKGGPDTDENLLSVCEHCHLALHHLSGAIVDGRLKFEVARGSGLQYHLKCCSQLVDGDTNDTCYVNIPDPHEKHENIRRRFCRNCMARMKKHNHWETESKMSHMEVLRELSRAESCPCPRCSAPDVLTNGKYARKGIKCHECGKAFTAAGLLAKSKNTETTPRDVVCEAEDE